MLDFGFNLGQLVTGRPATRGQSGCALRWGSGWFEEFRDSGPGWSFSKDDRAAISARVDLIISLFDRDSRLPRLQDDILLALPFQAFENGIPF